jgi:hypothetical protein
MTSVTTTTTAPATARTRRTLADWLARKQDGLSTRVHAAGDAAMAQAGLTVTASTGRFGFGARTYRHPGFDSRH